MSVARQVGSTSLQKVPDAREEEGPPYGVEAGLSEQVEAKCGVLVADTGSSTHPGPSGLV